MALASEPRVLLENLLPSRARGGVRRTVSHAAIEERLDAILRSRGEAGLQAVRDAARALAPSLGAEKTFEALNRMMAATLGSRPAHRARSRVLGARMLGAPYDPGAIARIDQLVIELGAGVFPERHDTVRAGKAWDLIAFFDAYFSNYIEGTEFEVNEARAIVFEQKIPSKRPADAHDVLGTYALVADSGAMSHAPSALGPGAEFEDLLSRWHGMLMAGRPEVAPGTWKTIPNRAGDTIFVSPDLARGTMRAGFERVRAMGTPFARAVGLMFLITEVHPFADGNGRLARAVMNAELIAGQQRRILIPTVYRDDYLGALRRLSRQNDPTVLPKMLDIAQTFTTAVSFTDYDSASAQLAQSNAFRASDEARLLIPTPRAIPPQM
ncbi:MAG: Fic family protein [Gemmatimonadales bacterium]|nr:Fic family protein [Gemmatimonadales bacterium]